MSLYSDASLVFLPRGGAGKDGKAYSMKPVPEYGNELVTNGGFDTDSDWNITSGTDANISNGKANFVNAAKGQRIQQNFSFTANKTYKVILEVSNYTSGILGFYMGGVYAFNNVSANGIYTYYVTPVNTAEVFLRAMQTGVSHNFSIDNVSVKEVVTPSADFDFSRGSNLTATRVDSNGLIEKGRENLLENSVWDGVSTDTKPTGWSNQFLSGTGTFDVTATEGQIRFQTLDASSRAFIYSPTITTNGIVVVSVYVDEVTTAIPLSYLLSRSGSATFLFAYEDGVEINYSDNVQAGKRYSVVFNKTASTTFRFGVGTSSGTLGDVVLSRPQIEIGLVATEWITSPVGSKGFAGILEDSPRFDYSGGASCPSLLLEPSRTNILEYSEYFEDSFYIKDSGVSATSNQIISPEGLQNGSLISVGSNGRLYANHTSGTYISSVFIKAGTFSHFKISGQNVDLTTSPISVGSLDFEDYGNGWYRIYGSYTGNRGFQIQAYPDNTYSSHTDSGNYYIYGAVIEEGSYPTSYIPNHSGGSVTRNAEENTTANISSVIGQQEGTFFLDFEFLDGATAENQNWIALESEDGQSRVLFYKSAATNDLRLLITADDIGVFSKSNLVAISPNTRYKVAVRYSSGEQGVAANGSMVGVNGTSTYTRTSLLSRVKFNESNIQPSCRVHQAIVFESGLTDSELETLTS